MQSCDEWLQAALDRPDRGPSCFEQPLKHGHLEVRHIAWSDQEILCPGVLCPTNRATTPLTGP